MTNIFYTTWKHQCSSNLHLYLHCMKNNANGISWQSLLNYKERKYLCIDKIQQDATVCRYLFTANVLYMFRVSIAPIIRST